MSKKRKDRLVIVFFVLLVGYFANRGLFAAILIENTLLVLFFAFALFILLKGLHTFYVVFIKTSRTK